MSPASPIKAVLNFVLLLCLSLNELSVPYISQREGFSFAFSFRGRKFQILGLFITCLHTLVTWNVTQLTGKAFKALYKVF